MNPEILKFSRWLHLRDAVLKAEGELAGLKERFERATDDLALILAPLDGAEERQKRIDAISESIRADVDAVASAIKLREGQP